MSKKKNGVLQFTAEDCRKKGKRLKKRCDYTKIAEAIGQINIQIKESLVCGGTEVQIGRFFDDNVLPVLIYTYHWEKEDSVPLSKSEWDMIVQQLNNSGFTVTIDEHTRYIDLSW